MGNRWFLLLMSMVSVHMATFGMEQVDELRKIEWSIVKLALNGTYQQSFIFNTENVNVVLLLIKTDMHTYLFKNSPDQQDLWFSDENSSADTISGPIDGCVPFAYKDGDGYLIYLSKKVGDKYKVYSATLKKNESGKLKDLNYYHNTPIKRMCMVEKDSKKFLVTGSDYPSIKIYDIKKGKIIDTMYNRFLIGSNNNTLFYAKKNDIPSFGPLGRWFAYRENKKNACTLYKLEDFFNQDNEQFLIYDSLQLEREVAHYPLFVTNGSEKVFLFSEGLYFYNATDVTLDTNVSNLCIVRRGKKIDYIKATKLSMKDFFTNDDSKTYFKSLITYEGFILFAQENPSKNVKAYIDTIITKFLLLKLDQGKYFGRLKENIIDKFQRIIARTGGTLEKTFFNRDGYKKIVECVRGLPFDINLYTETSVDSYEIITDKHFEKVCVNKNFVAGVMGNALFYGKINNKKIMFKKSYELQDPVKDIYFVGNTFFYLTDKKLCSINVEAIHRKNDAIATYLVYPKEQVDAIAKLVNALQTSSNGLINLFNKSNRLSFTDEERGQFYKDANNLIKELYIKKILYTFVDSLLKPTDKSNLPEELFGSIRQIIVNTLLKQAKWTNDTSLSSLLQLMRRDNLMQRNDENKETIKKYFEGFKLLLNDEDLMANFYFLYYGIENIKIGSEQKTYLEYVRDFFKKKSTEILPNLNLNPQELLHQATRTESK